MNTALNDSVVFLSFIHVYALLFDVSRCKNNALV